MHTFRPTTRFIGQYFKHLAEVDSTNDQLLLEAAHLPEGALFLADCQNAGKGQNGRVWQADSGKHLTFSFLLKPLFLPASGLYSLNMVVALGIIDALAQVHDTDFILKWPNDLYVGARKLGGVLIETTLQGNHVRQAVVGIGLNVNQPMSNISTLRAIALVELTHRLVDRFELLHHLVFAIENRYLSFQQLGAHNLIMEYQRKLLGYQEFRRFEIPDGSQFEGMIMGVDLSGQLLVRHHGKLEAFAHGTIKMLFEDEIVADSTR